MSAISIIMRRSLGAASDILRADIYRKKLDYDRCFDAVQRAPACGRVVHQFVPRRYASSDSDAVQIINNLEEFKTSVSKAPGLTVAYFTAAWCGPCKFIWPHVTTLAKENSTVKFLKIDVDEAADVAAANDISAMPTFVLLKQGKRVDNLVGANPAALRELVAKHSKVETMYCHDMSRLYVLKQGMLEQEKRVDNLVCANPAALRELVAKHIKA